LQKKNKIVCFWWGNWCGKYGPKYVDRLYNSVLKHTTLPFEFYCMTDRPDLIKQNAIKFNPRFKWNLNKLLVFEQNFDLNDRIITIDLDTVFMDNIDFILADNSQFIVNESFGDRGQCGGGIVSTTYKYGRLLLNKLIKNYETIEAQTKGSERFFYRKYVTTPKFWQRKYSGIYSYKKHCQKGVPKDAKIVHYHGRPRPHEVMEDF